MQHKRHEHTRPLQDSFRWSRGGDKERQWGLFMFRVCFACYASSLSIFIGFLIRVIFIVPICLT